MSAVKNVIKDNYNMMLLNNYLRKKIKESGFAKVEVSKTPTGTRVILHVTRPGIVIGRKGTGIKELTEKLESEFGLKNPQLSVEEIKKPELSPRVMCNRMASHLERGTAFRRATMWTMQQIMENGAMGTQITISGSYVVIDQHLKNMSQESYQELDIMQMLLFRRILFMWRRLWD